MSSSERIASANLIWAESVYSILHVYNHMQKVEDIEKAQKNSADKWRPKSKE